MDHARNDMSYWFPILEATGVTVPETVLFQTDVDLRVWLDGEKPEGLEAFMAQLSDAGERLGYPCFLRTGQTSGKHDWAASCYIDNPDYFARNVPGLLEYSEMACIIGLPYRTWAVRRFLPLVAPFTAFGGMPVAREFRCFFRDHAQICLHPYWPPAAIGQVGLGPPSWLDGPLGSPNRPEWRLLLEAMNRLKPDDEAEIRGIVARVAAAFDGGWSLDIAQTLDGEWVCIDMATMEESFHWPDCPLASPRNQPQPEGVQP